MLRRTSALAGVLSCALSLTPSVSRAAAPGDSSSSTFINYDPGAPERRGGFTLGLAAGLGLSDFSGYPNEIAKLGDPAFEGTTGSTFGNAFSFWAGGALRDWLTVSVGARFAFAAGNENVGSAFGTTFRVEAYPFYSLGGGYRDLGIGLDGGIAFAQVFDQADTTTPIADGGSMALVGASVFYEPFRFWQMTTGPSLVYAHAFSQSMTVHQLMLGWRVSFYGILPKGKNPSPETAQAPERPRG